MIGGILFLQGTTLFSGGIGDVLNNLQQAGFFSYIIPFLLIFALVYGILFRMNLFRENKAVTSIIALAVGLMSLQLDIVPKFFSQIFPRFGIAISIILVLLIIAGLFLDPEKPWIMYILLGIAAVIVMVVLVQSAGSLGIPIGNWLQDNWQSALVIAIVAIGVIGGIIAIINSSKERGNPEEYNSYMVRIPEKEKRH